MSKRTAGCGVFNELPRFNGVAITNKCKVTRFFGIRHFKRAFYAAEAAALSFKGGLINYGIRSIQEKVVAFST